MGVLRDIFLTMAKSLLGWSYLFKLLADFSTCDGGYRDSE